MTKIYEDTDKVIYLDDPGEFDPETGEEISPRVERIEWVNKNHPEYRLQELELENAALKEALIAKKTLTEKDLSDQRELIKPVEPIRDRAIVDRVLGR